MPQPNGSFTEANLLDVQVKMDKIWPDAIGEAQYRANVESFLAIKEQQTARFAPLTSSDKDNQVRIVWLDACDEKTNDCADDCSVGGEEISANSKLYDLQLCRSAGFSVREKALRSTIYSYEEIVARAMLAKMKVLDEFFTGYVLTIIWQNMGVSSFVPDGWSLSASPDRLDVPGNLFNLDIITDLQQVAIMNRFASPFVLSGSNLWRDFMRARDNMGNDNGKGDAARSKQIQTYFDLWNVDTFTNPDRFSFLINRGAVAIESKAYYETPRTYMDNMRYSVQSKNLPGVKYDVVYRNRCESNEIIHDFSIYLNGGVFINPTGCVENRTGIIGIKKK